MCEPLERYYLSWSSDEEHWSVFYRMDDECNPEEAEEFVSLMQTDIESTKNPFWAATHVRIEPTADGEPSRFADLESEWRAFARYLAEEFPPQRVYPPADRGVYKEAFRLYCAAYDYARGFRATRPRVEENYLLADFRQGVWEVFDFVDCLTQDEVDDLECLLRPEIYELAAVGFATMVKVEVQKIPVLAIRLDEEWRQFEEELIEGRELENLHLHGASQIIIERILALRTERAEPSEAHETTSGGKGVSLQDAAERIRPGDADGQRDLAKKWRNSRTPKLPQPIGKCPDHKQRSLYEPAALLAFLKKFEGKQVDADFELNTYFRRVSRKVRQ